jgi:hypothetical protein
MSDSSLGGIRDRGQIINAGGYFKEARLDWTSGDIDYQGVNEVKGADEGATTWLIWKFTWAGGKPTRIEGPLEGSWTNRASLDWI